MKLLFDQNLSFKLVQLLEDIYPGSVHVRDIQLGGADDLQIFELALRGDFVVVTKDSDFKDILTFREEGRVVILRTGNTSTHNIHLILRNQSEQVFLLKNVATGLVILP